MDIVDLANETIPQTYGGEAAAPTVEPPPPVQDKPLDLRTREGRAAAGLPPKSPPPRPGAGPRPKRGTAGKTSPKTGGLTDYRPGINGIGQMLAFGISFGAPADAAAIMVHTPGIAEALNNLAAVKPEVAAVLDRLMTAGPYGEIMMAVVPLVVQILCNHNRVPAGMLGSVPADELIKMVS